MIPWKHQIETAEEAISILRQNMIVYLAMEERTGKTLSAILVCEELRISKVLVVTKKKALPGWFDTLKAFQHTKVFDVVNYHQAKKRIGIAYDLIILDESHNYISAYPKPGLIWKQIKALTAGVPLIYISATPYAQGPQQLYHQFALSSWSPWLRFKNFYKWFAEYGRPFTLEINGIERPQYTKTHMDKILQDVNHLFITKTRQDLGFRHEPEDHIHWIELDHQTKKVYNELLEHELVELPIGTLVCDTKVKLRTTLHQIEGGTVKIEDERYILVNDEKVRYILAKWGDTEDLVIMYNFIKEADKLAQYFNKATILQATSNAEGVDLHKFKTLVVYSQDYSTARHTQRRARQANLGRKEPIHVHFLLVKKAISAQVYRTVSINKKNYVDSVFDKEKL